MVHVANNVLPNSSGGGSLFSVRAADKITGKPRGFAFVHFEDPQSQCPSLSRVLRNFLKNSPVDTKMECTRTRRDVFFGFDLQMRSKLSASSMKSKAER
jgi:hypothetical protein